MILTLRWTLGLLTLPLAPIHFVNLRQAWASDGVKKVTQRTNQPTYVLCTYMYVRTYIYTDCACVCSELYIFINAFANVYICMIRTSMHLTSIWNAHVSQVKLHLQNSTLLKLSVWRGIKGFCEGIKFTEANPSISWEIRCKNWATLKFGRY